MPRVQAILLGGRRGREASPQPRPSQHDRKTRGCAEGQGLQAPPRQETAPMRRLREAGRRDGVRHMCGQVLPVLSRDMPPKGEGRLQGARREPHRSSDFPRLRAARGPAPELLLHPVRGPRLCALPADGGARRTSQGLAQQRRPPTEERHGGDGGGAQGQEGGDPGLHQQGGRCHGRDAAAVRRDALARGSGVRRPPPPHQGAAQEARGGD
mmetsp:Transcript_28700/g.72720  ORF Transcript_28700/g.72720 Transcript_28700/m.72720 type:complete len:211 (+) Transcript_28700:313-945(+)